MLSKELFIFAHQMGDKRFYSAYKELLQSQWKPHPEQKYDQESQLRHLIHFAYDNVPYYHKLFARLQLSPFDISNVKDLEKLPILTKEIIKDNWQDFKPANLDTMKYYEISTGGSTGTPLRYRLFKYDRFLSGAMLYRGWGYAGYELGDKMVILAGASLKVGPKPNLIQKAHEISRNIRKLSSFDMSEEEMYSYVKVINSYKPRFIRGYSSSIYFFSKWIADNNLLIHKPLAVFTTAEKLYPHMRVMIKDVFDCEVYDGYGLNDGGVGAYECSEHSGLHIDMERSVMEVVDEDGHQLNEGMGRILATSLYNYAMPFIRYDTGDIGHIILENCNCGRGSKLLKEIVGRSVDILITPEGKHIHGEFFTHIFWEIPHVKEFQIKQAQIDRLVFNIIPEPDFDEANLERIRKAIKVRSSGWKIDFHLVDTIERTHAGKHKFVINELGKV